MRPVLERILPASAVVVAAHEDLEAGLYPEVEAVVGYLQALVGLYRADGSLLDRRGVSTPGAAAR